MEKKITVLLDNGHGVDTKGKCSPIWGDGTQLFEWKFTRTLVDKIAVRLVNEDIPVFLIVPSDYDLPLDRRCGFVNLWKSGECFLISIHGNAGGGTGFEVWTSRGETKSDKIATLWVEQIKKDFPDIKMRCDYSDGDPDKESNFYILKHTKCPAILTENLFMDTEKDCRLMMDDEFLDKLADSYVVFIKNVLKTLY